MTTATPPPLIRSLQNPALYPHAATDFRLIETHISWLLLVGSYAYKIKKPLDLGFLDFSTLEKRHFFCLEELRLNSRLAPAIYIEVITIRGSETQPRLDGTGTIIDYAVKMRRFDHHRTFDHLLKRQLLSAAHLKETARIIARFHDHIALASAASVYGQADTVMQPVRENFTQIERLGDSGKTEVLVSLSCWSEKEFSKRHDLFAHRKRQGFIRECHGDLHLGNIVLIDDKIVPFDGIEFNPALYWIDVISEVAFLVMDLCDNRRPDLAFQFLNAYLQHSGDYPGLKLLRFYLVYRAMVRAKVDAIRVCQSTDNEQKRQMMNEYHAYLRLARDFTHPTSPFLLLMHGVSGSGKSWLSDRIIEHFPAIRIRSDVERKRLFQKTHQQQNQSGIDQGLYNADATAQTYRQLLTLAEEVLAAGFVVIVDATFLQWQQRQPFFELAEQKVIPIGIIHTAANKTTLRQRLAARAKQQNNVSDADQRILQHQLHRLQPLSQEELSHACQIDTADADHLTRLWKFLDEFKL